MRTSNLSPNPAPDAAQRFRDAFERLKLGVPEILPKGSHVSQNNVAKEAGCDPSALRKARFPLLVLEIQEWIHAHKHEQPASERRKVLKQRKKNREARETIADLKLQRDTAVGLLADANRWILELTAKATALQTELDELRPAAKILSFPNLPD